MNLYMLDLEHRTCLFHT